MRRSATVRAEPLLVQPRWLLHAAFLALMLAVVAVLVVVRRGDLDFEEELGSAGLLVLCLLAVRARRAAASCAACVPAMR